MASSTKLMENELAEYENKARAVCIGVNHLALDTERIKQEELLQKVKELEDQLMDMNYTKTNLPKRASDIRSDVKSNSAALRYLETISQLERSFTVLTDNVSETSVQLSSPKSLPESVLLKKELSGNVQSCWNYVSQLSRLAQVHIRNAAEYHQFHHVATEIEASVNRRVRMTHPDRARALPDELSSAPIMANEYRDHLNHFLHLWGRSGQLLEDSRRVVPVHLRLGGIKNGVNVNSDKPVMARTLLSLAGPNYELEEGEEVRIISNSDDQHFWKVQTTSGVADVPSVCLWISDADREAVKRAIEVRQKCTEGWELLVERMRERLRVYYTRLLNDMADKGDIAYTSKPMMQNFLSDLDHLYPPSDAAGAELKQAADRFADRLVLVERGMKPDSETILREQDIVSMHSPLMRFRDHENQMDSLNVQSPFTGNDMANYLQEIDADRKRVSDEMAIMNSLQREHQAQLEHLIGRVRKWSSRYDKKFHLELGHQDSYLSASPRSSIRSDHGWRSEPLVDEPTITPTVRQPVAAGLPRSPSMRDEDRAVVDTITQIGVQTKTEGVQTSPTQSSRTDVLRQSPRNLKEAVCQIGQVTASTVSQTELNSARTVPEPRSKSYDAIVQAGQIVEDSSVHRIVEAQPTVLPTPAPPVATEKSDAVVQVGTISKDAYVQSDPVEEPIVAMQQQPIQQSARRPSVVDTTCYIARDSCSTSVETQSMDVAPPKKEVNDAVCQIGKITTSDLAQTDDYLMPYKKNITQQSTAVCDMGKLLSNHQIQTEPEEPPPVQDICCQIGTIQKPKAVQTKKENRPIAEDSEFEWNKPAESHLMQTDPRAPGVDIQAQAGTVSAPHEIQTDPAPPGVDIQTQAGTVSAPHDTQTDPEPEKPAAINVQAQTGTVSAPREIQTDPAPPGVNVQTQAGTVSAPHEIQTDPEPEKPAGVNVQAQTGTVSAPREIQTDAPARADVQAQSGTVSSCSEMQTESPKAVDALYIREATKKGNNVELQTGTVHQHKAMQAEEEEKIPVLPCMVSQQSAAPRRNDSVEVQVGTVSQAATTQANTSRPQSHVELQTGVISSSKASQIVEEVKPRSKSFDVLTQVGVSTQSQGSQYAPEPVAKPAVYNAEIQSGTISQPKALQTMEVVKPISNVETQCGSVSHLVGTQTTEAPVKSVRRYEVEAQAGNVYVSSWTQTKQPGRDLVLATEEEVKQKGADVETQAGTVKKSVELQTTEAPTEDVCYNAERECVSKELQIALEPTRSDVQTQAGTCSKSDSVQAELRPSVEDSLALYEKQIPEVPSINKKLQFTLQRKTEDAQTQHDVVPPKQITSVDDAMLIYQKSVPQNHAQIQTLRPDSGIDSCLEAEEDIKPELQAPVKAEIPKRDVEAQSGVLTDTAFVQTMEEPEPEKVQVNDAQVQMIFQTGYQDYTAQILPTYSAVESQTMEPKKLELQDTHVALQTQNHDSTMQTEEEVKPIVSTSTTGAQADFKTVTYDVECQSGITAQTSTTQTDSKQPLNDLQYESSVCVQTSTTQTKAQVVPKVVGKDVQIDTAQADVFIDSVLETEEPVKVQEVVRVNAVTPRDESGIQAQILPLCSTAESQTIEPKKEELRDVQVADQKQNRDSIMQTDVEAKPTVVTLNTATQANYRPIGYDVECQSSIPTVPVCQCRDLQYQSIQKPTPKAEAIIQTEKPPQLQDTRMTFKREIFDSDVQTVEEVKVPVPTPTVSAEHIVRSDDAQVQTELKQPLNDVQCESSVRVQTSTTQTKPQVVPKAVTQDAEVETMQPFIDAVLETEEEVIVQQVAPVKAVIPMDESGIQAQILPPCSTAESQTIEPKKEELRDVQVADQKQNCDSTMQTDPAPRDEAATQADFRPPEPPKPEFADVRVAYQKSERDAETQSETNLTSDAVQSDTTKLNDASVLYENITPLVNKKLNVALIEPLVNKKLQVALQSPGSDFALQTEKELFNVETQAGILSQVASMQTDEEPKKIVPVEDASVLSEKEVIPAVNKKLQVLLSPTVSEDACQTDTVVRKPSVNVNKKLQVAIGPPSQDEMIQEDEIKPVDTVGLQAVVQLERFDVETQSGPAVSENRNVEFIAEKPQPEVKVLQNVQAMAPVPKSEMEVQAVIIPERFDIECQSGIVPVVEANVQQEKPPEKLQNKKLQVALSQPIQELQYQAVEARPAPVAKSDRELQTNIVPEVSDVELQTGVKSQEGSTQTISEEPPPKVVLHDTQVASVKAIAPAEMQTEEEPVKVAPVMAAPPIQKDDREIQAAIVPQTFDVQLQSGVKSQEGGMQTEPEPAPAKNKLEDLVVSSVLPTTTQGMQATAVAASTYDAESQSAIRGQEGSTQTKAEPAPVRPEVQDVQLAFAKAVAPAEMQTVAEPAAPKAELQDIQAVSAVPHNTIQLQATLSPETYDAELQTGVVSQEIGTEAFFESLSLDSEVQSHVVNQVHSAQTKAEPLPAKPEVRDVELAFAKAVAPAEMQTDEQKVQLAPVSAAAPVQKDDRQVQAVIAPQNADVELQSGVTCQEGSTQTAAEPAAPKREIQDVQTAFSVPCNSVELQTSLSPEKQDAELQTGVVSKSKGTEAYLESISLDSEAHRAMTKAEPPPPPVKPEVLDVQLAFAKPVASAEMQTVAEPPPAPKVGYQNMQAAYVAPAVAAGIQTDEPVNVEKTEPTKAAPIIPKDNREVQASVESVMGSAQTDAPQSTMRTDVSYTKPAPERSSKNKKLQVNMFTPVESVQASTQSDTQAPKPSIYDSIVTTVTYGGMGQKPKPQESKPIVMDTYAQCVTASTKKASDVCTQTPKQEKESLAQSVVSYKGTPKEIIESREVVTYQKLEVPQKMQPLLLDDAFSFVSGQRNKKLQAILPMDEDARPVMPEKAESEKKEMSAQTDLEAKETSVVAQAIPKIKIDAECQSKVAQIGKKMQFSPSYHEESSQTDSQSLKHTTTYNVDTPVVQPTVPIRTSPPIVEQYTSHQQSKKPISKIDVCTQSLPSPLKTQTVTYTTKVLQTETAVVPPSIVSKCSHSIQQAVKPAAPKRKIDAAIGVEIAPADKNPYITSQVQLDVPTKDTTMQTTGAEVEQPTQVPKRHVRIQKGSSWLDTRLVDDETQIDPDMTDFIIQPQEISNIQVKPPTDMVDANEAYVPPRARPASITSPSGSLRGSSTGYRPYRPEVVSWGIQCTPVTLTGVTQTNGYFKSEGDTQGRIYATRVGTTPKSDAEVQCNIDIGDDYFLKRVVTTVSRRGAVSTYKRTGPVVRRILPRSHAHVLATSLPSHLDADFFDEDDDDIEGPVTTRKITTTDVEGGGRLVHEELITEDPRERGRVRSADSRSYYDILDAMEAKSEPNMDAEQCFRNLVNAWGRDYLFQRLRHHGSTMSVDRDTAANIQRSSGRLVGAKTQYTSCGNIAIAPTSLRNMETQTFGTASAQRPPHKNKRIQRGPSCISWPPGQLTGMNITGEEQGPLSQSNVATSYTESMRRQSTLETAPQTTEEYVCPKCGTSARLPLAASMQSQPLPITQLRNERSQTKSSGYFTLDSGGLTLPVYMSDKDVLRINPTQDIYDDPELSSVTWCPADEKSVESRGTSTKDEVWIDNPGKLLEVQVTGVTVPGTNKTITAAEAFYRGLLRVVYWDYTKAGAREPSESSAAIPLADAVVMNNVKLGAKRIPGSSGQSVDTAEGVASTMDANVVWTAPETHRTRYEVRAIRPEIEHVKEGTGKEYNLASAIEAGYIDRKTGLVVVKPSIFSKDRLPGDDTPEKVFVTDAINRGIVLADLIESDSSYPTAAYSPTQQDMDI